MRAATGRSVVGVQRRVQGDCLDGVCALCTHDSPYGRIVLPRAVPAESRTPPTHTGKQKTAAQLPAKFARPSGQERARGERPPLADGGVCAVEDFEPGKGVPARVD